MTLLRDQIGQHVFPLHRLDRQTDGVLLFALSSESAKVFSSCFRNDQDSEYPKTQKDYLAICRGFAPESKYVDHALKPQLDKQADKFAAPKEPESAQTQFQRLLTTELDIAVDRYPSARYSLMKASPITGRKHQIRRHLKHLRHPLLVDAKHGDRFHNQMLRERFNIHRLLLRAMSIEIFHPYKNEIITVNAGLTQEWQTLLAVFGWAEQCDQIKLMFEKQS
jgi:tRNA pseudouridine65 synthase